MGTYYLAVDIGASGGRHILGHLENGVMKLEEIYRFPNGMDRRNGRLCWDTRKLFEEILCGMRRCAEAGKIPASMGVDTWGVDFVLLNAAGEIVGETVGYRDSRTEGMDRKVYEKIGPKELYRRTGIQKQPYNTVYQLMAVKELEPAWLEEADCLLLMPDYFHYRLTGERVTEYTEATTTQLLDPRTKDWDRELIRRLGYPEHIFMPVRTPGTTLGRLQKEIAEQVGFDCAVVLPATHDTGSAVLAVPVFGRDGEGQEKQALYISSGTWSLMGIERQEADCSLESMEHNFTNEGGYGYRFRYLKNIMGLWMIQSVKKELAPDMSYAQLCQEASAETISSLVDCNAERFLAPESMTEEVQAFCRESGQQVPQGAAQTAAVIYNSLADCYRQTAEEIETLTGRRFDAIHVVGGGSNADYLNRLTAEYTGKKVYAGPGEATSIGNLLAQMLAAGEVKGLEEARKCVYDSFRIEEYKGLR